MSLLSSIFGGKPQEEEAKTATSGLFEKTIDVPERSIARFADAKADAKRKRGEDTSESPAAAADGETKDDSKKSPRVDKEDAKELTVFVGNLPSAMTRRSLAKLFKGCGKISSTRIRSVAVAGVKLPPSQAGNQKMVKKVCANTQQLDKDAKQTVTGYVVFCDKESVEAALAMNNTEVPDIATGKQRKIRVDRAEPTTDASRSVFVGNLPYGADEATLQAHFAQACGWQKDDGAVEGVRIVRDKDTFQCKGFGYILFRDRSLVSTALRNVHETTYMKRELRVMVCGSRFKGNKGKPQEPDPKKQRTFEGQRATGPVQSSSVSALKRILTKSTAEASGKKHRPRGEKKSSTPGKAAGKPGVSRRAAVDAKVEKRVKKIKKRIAKGMGKAKIR